MIVSKFGGTSLADAAQILKVVDVIKSDSRRRGIVVSAPGKRNAGDVKITDLLIDCQKKAERGEDFSGSFKIVRDRYREIARELGVEKIVESLLEEIEETIPKQTGSDYAPSRGEYLCARIAAELLDYQFLDAEGNIYLTGDGRVHERTYELTSLALRGKDRYVVPGFFGTTMDEKIKCFSRGGSDITGAIIARCAGAELYENWTDVSGILMADPRIVVDPKPIRELTYHEIRELASIGASVFHEDAIAPVRDVKITINVKNTNYPEAPGTLIVHSRETGEVPVAGISGKKPYKNLFVKKLMLNRYPRYREEVLRFLEERNITPEFESKGFDSMSFLVHEELVGDEAALLEAVREKLDPDDAEMKTSMAVIGIVGQGIEARKGIASKIFNSLDKTGVNVRFINYGGSEITVLVGVDTGDYARALNALYSVFA